LTSDPKKLSIGALSHQLPAPFMLARIPFRVALLSLPVRFRWSPDVPSSLGKVTIADIDD
jgi:hypothetical protein